MNEHGKSAHEARVELDRVQGLAAPTRRAGQRWMRVYLLVWAAATAVPLVMAAIRCDRCADVETGR